MENEWYELSAREKISKAKITLMNQQVFFGNLTIHLNPIVVEFIPTAGIDPYGNLYYNEKWINSLSEEELQGVLCHEVLHEVFDDLERCGYRHQRIWNYAADYANNILLLGNNFKLPNGALINSQYKNMIKEEIYDKLMKNVKIINIPLCRGNCGNCKVMGGKQNSQDKGMCRKKAGFDYHLSKDDAKEGMKEIKGKDISGKDWRGILTNAYRQAKNQGCLPGGWDRIFKQLFPPKINWRTILLRFMESYLPKL